MSAQHEQSHDERAGFWRRLNTWWAGDDRGVTPVREPSLGGREARTFAESEIWPAERIRVLNGLFGDGMIAPWSDQIQDRLVQDLDLEEDSRVVVMGGGLGGPAHRLQEATGANVLALDDRVDIADLAQGWLSDAGAVARFDRRDYFDTGLKPDFADVIIAFGGFSHIRDKKRLFSHLLQILRPNGRIVFMDFFVTGMDPECPEVAVWSALEDRPRYPMSLSAFGDLAYDIGFDYPDYRDVTEAHVTSIRTSFGRSVDIMKQAGADAPRLQPFLVAELEHWNRRLALMESGEVRYYQATVEYFGKSAVV
ncbi:methyltransferase domain-containing protein [Minwuia sp.]|uniref:methyltransferase domain-containing protein n=1 Tax=Minwuia sp. TaxID=2493630 RepID=UPI003A8FFBE1